MAEHIVGGRVEHVLEDATQYIPVDNLQSVSPHLQSVPAMFSVVPSVTAHVVGGRDEQVLESQYIPVVEVQVAIPHVHGLSTMSRRHHGLSYALPGNVVEYDV